MNTRKYIIGTGIARQKMCQKILARNLHSKNHANQNMVILEHANIIILANKNILTLEYKNISESLYANIRILWMGRRMLLSSVISKIFT